MGLLPFSSGESLSIGPAAQGHRPEGRAGLESKSCGSRSSEHFGEPKKCGAGIL